MGPLAASPSKRQMTADVIARAGRLSDHGAWSIARTVSPSLSRRGHLLSATWYSSSSETEHDPQPARPIPR